MFPLKIPENQRPIVNIIAVMVIVIVVGSFFVPKHKPIGHKPNITQGLHEAIARRAALETGELLGHKGKIVVVALDKGSPPIPSAEEEFTAFIQALGQTGEVVVVSVKRVDTELIRKTVDNQFFGMPYDVYLDVLAGYPNVDAIVSFLGGPLLTDAELATLPKNRPRFVAVQGLGFGGNLKKLFEKDVIQLAIMFQYDIPTPKTTSSASGQEVFDRGYVVVKTSNYQQAIYFEDHMSRAKVNLKK